jgi:NitT/TauT family transport system substrate-binding protein
MSTVPTLSRLAAIGAALMSCGVLAACGSSGSGGGDAAASSGDMTKLTIGTLSTDSCSALYTAQQKGFFKAEKLDVKLDSIASGAAISSGVLGGSLQIGCSSVGSVASAYAQGVPVAVVSQGAVYSSKEPTSALMVAAKSPVRSAADLNGKTIAVNALKNVTQVAAEAWIAKNGGDPKSVKFIELPFPQMGAALAAGRAAAAVVAEPSVTIAEQKGQARVLGDAYDAIANRFSISTFFSSRSWATSNKDVVARFQRALSRAGAYSNSHQAETAKVLSQASGLSPQVAARMKRAEWETSIDLKTLQPPIDAAARFGAISKPVKAGDLLVKG